MPRRGKPPRGAAIASPQGEADGIAPPHAGAPRSRWSRLADPDLVAAGAALLLAAAFVALCLRVLATLSWEYDEGTFMLEARAILRGGRPFLDFFHHQPPLHLHLLALSAEIFGPTVLGYRMLSVASMAGSGLLLFALVRPFAGAVPALAAEAAFLFSPSEVHALGAVGEAPMLFASLAGIALLFLGRGGVSVAAAGAAFVFALLIKPTCLVVVVAAAASLVWARRWRRLFGLAVSGAVAAAIGIAWTVVQSDGVFSDMVLFQLQRLGAGVDVFGILRSQSGFGELLDLLGIETRGQWAWFTFRGFNYVSDTLVPIGLLVTSLLGIPVWLARCARGRPDLQAFVVLWPGLYALANFVAMPYVSSKYYVPFLAFSAFLLAGIVWLVQSLAGARVTAVATALGAAALAFVFQAALERESDPWYYARAEWLAGQHRSLVSFTPMTFAANGLDPACGFVNPANTFGFGGGILDSSERVKKFRVTEKALIDCLRMSPDTRFVVDYWYYFFTRPGDELRTYLRGEGAPQVVFFSPWAYAHWDEPRLRSGAVAR